jgi:hypothetical protein
MTDGDYGYSKNDAKMPICVIRQQAAVDFLLSDPPRVLPLLDGRPIK